MDPNGSQPAAQRALNVFEIVEQILLYLPRYNILALALVTRSFDLAIHRSVYLRRKLFLHPLLARNSDNTWTPAEINTLLLKDGGRDFGGYRVTPQEEAWTEHESVAWGPCDLHPRLDIVVQRTTSETVLPTDSLARVMYLTQPPCLVWAEFEGPRTTEGYRHSVFVELDGPTFGDLLDAVHKAYDAHGGDDAEGLRLIRPSLADGTNRDLLECELCRLSEWREEL